jgi:hypothetical protein
MGNIHLTPLNYSYFCNYSPKLKKTQNLVYLSFNFFQFHHLKSSQNLENNSLKKKKKQTNKPIYIMNFQRFKRGYFCIFH